MAQHINNTYTPQYNYYYPTMPKQFETQAVQTYPYAPQPAPVMVQQPRWDVVPQLAQRMYGAMAANLPQPQDVQTATQNIFNQPVYAQSYYSNPQVARPVYNNPFVQQQVPASVDLCPWVTDPELKLALNKLAEITHDPADIAHIQSIGIIPPFNSGKEALDYIVNNHIKVEFADMGDSLAHAQWVNDENKMIINKNYQGKMTQPMALAIADALYHEAGHAKDKDGVASVQEELDCLSLNVLGYRYQQKKYPEIMNSSDQSRLLSDGVALYPKLFFDQDPRKEALINRVKEKYGFLPVSSPNHDAAKIPLAQVIKQSFMTDKMNEKQA
ncbi:MAG: hypothetical protein AB7V50_07505 [Vampirovibrionia bacterium]